jgi:hypothetical protein
MRPPRRADLLIIFAFGAAMALLAALRQEFIGDGIRHLPDAIGSSTPSIGTPRWLLFPAVVWVIVHSPGAAGVIDGVESAIRVLAGLTVACALAYLGA